MLKNQVLILIFYTLFWAASSEVVSSSIPSWQILTAHAQPFRGARDLAFCLKVPLDSMLVWASSGGSGETARMRRLAWTFAARIGDKYQIRLTRSIFRMFLCHLYEFYVKSMQNKRQRKLTNWRFWPLGLHSSVMMWHQSSFRSTNPDAGLLVMVLNNNVRWSIIRFIGGLILVHLRKVGGKCNYLLVKELIGHWHHIQFTSWQWLFNTGQHII